MHSYYAYLEQHNKAQAKYYLKWIRGTKDDRHRMGCDGLGPHADQDFKKEYEKIQNELKKRGLKRWLKR